MKNLVKRIGILALGTIIFGLGMPTEASAGLLHHEKSPAMRQHKAEHKAHKTEKKMRAKKHLFSHGQ